MQIKVKQTTITFLFYNELKKKHIFKAPNDVRGNFDQLKSKLKLYVDDVNKCLNLFEQRDLVPFPFIFLICFSILVF
jgi:hypothetical protein